MPDAHLLQERDPVLHGGDVVGGTYPQRASHPRAGRLGQQHGTDIEPGYPVDADEAGHEVAVGLRDERLPETRVGVGEVSVDIDYGLVLYHGTS
ncbi:hypothetical protein GCM10025331_10870 [Actinoplanes utahensis]|nr:hypothetical protein Aut01nite_18110 [Actinoplanes utahensis]